jgi:hypothetical protein
MLQPVIVGQEAGRAVPQAVLVEDPVQPGLLSRAGADLIKYRAR